MARIPTLIRRGEMVEITVRTVFGRKLLRPTHEMTARLLGAIGRTIEKYPVLLHAFTYLSNHGHVLASVEDRRLLAAFRCYLNRNMALAVQSVLPWEGRVWATLTAPIPVLDDESAVDRLRYVLSNSVKEGLVDSPLDWPGPSSAHALLTGSAIESSWMERGTRHCKRIELAPLPCWAHLSIEHRCEKVRGLIDDVISSARRDRGGRPSLGVAAILAQDPLEPTELERRQPPIAHARSASALDEYVRARAEYIVAYEAASARLRRTPSPVAFPRDSFPPPLGFVDGAAAADNQAATKALADR